MRFDSSIELFKSARRLMPGGVSSPVRAISPNPFYTTKAEGPYLWDADGNRIIDYCLAYGPMILGHRHPTIVQAVTISSRKDGFTERLLSRKSVWLKESVGSILA